MRKCCTMLVIIAFISLPLHAGGQKAVPVTFMLQPGKTLVSEDLTQPLGKDWFDGKGQWTIVDGALRGIELAADEHGAVKRKPVKFDSGVVVCSFKLDGAKVISLSLNGAKGHICRVQIKPGGFAIVKDKDKKTGDKRLSLDDCKVAITPKEWHTMVIEVHGKEVLARLDNEYVAIGEHKDIAVAKVNVGLTVAGESASFKNLRVYEGTPMGSWSQQKAKLLDERKK